MYVEFSAKTVVTNVMKRLGWFLIMMSALYCSSARAEVHIIDSFVYGGPGETPWGDILGALTDGTLGGDALPINLADYRTFGRIDTFPLSASVSYDMDSDGYEESSTGSEVGLFYAEAYADVIETGIVYREWGSAQAEGSVCFSIDSSQLSLHWLYEISPYDFGFMNIYTLRVTDWETQEYVCFYSNVVGSPSEATETLDLILGRKYVLYWSLQVGAGWGFDNEGWARLTLDVEDIGSPVLFPDIDVSPASYDFGDVEIGLPETVIVSICNLGDTDLNIDNISFSSGSSSDFSITSTHSLPEIIAPAGNINVEISFSPSSIGYSSAVLEINSNDPDESLVEIDLGGVGVVIDVPPSEQVMQILEFIDESVDDNTLVADGPGKSADNRLKAFINMVEAAGELIDDGLYEEAYQQLEDVYQKCDGQSPPPDFVTGPAAVELAQLIQDLMASI